MAGMNLQVGAPIERLVLPGGEDADPENDQELHVGTGVLSVQAIPASECIDLHW